MASEPVEVRTLTREAAAGGVTAGCGAEVATKPIKAITSPKATTDAAATPTMTALGQGKGVRGRAPLDQGRGAVEWLGGLRVVDDPLVGVQGAEEVLRAPSWRNAPNEFIVLPP